MLKRGQKAKLNKYRRKVNNGVRVLDKEFGRKAWLKQIDLQSLNLSDNRSCVCGQIFGEYWNATFKKLGKDNMKLENFTDESDRWADRHGFYLAGHGDDDYDFLTNIWYVKIVELKIKAGLIP